MPDFREYVRKRLPPTDLSGEREAEVIEELALEAEERYHRALRCGATPEQAWQELGAGSESWRELADELRFCGDRPEPLAVPAEIHTSTAGVEAGERFHGLHELRRDLAYAVRQLRSSPGFSTIAVLMLALGIGANTAIFSLLNAVLLRTLPVQHPSQLVFLGQARAEGDTEFTPNGATQVFSYPFFREFRRRNEVFSDVAAIHSFLVSSYGRFGDNTGLQKLNLELVSGSYFHTLGINAAIGRALTDDDDVTPGAHPVAVARYSWWRDRSAPKTVTIGSTIYTIVGVAPPQFSGVTVGQSPDLWIPLAMQKQLLPDRSGLDKNLFQCLHLLGRIKPGVELSQAQANTNLLFRQILTSFLGPKPTADELKDIQRAHVDLTPAATGRSRLRLQFSSPLLVLMAVVALVLLIACANVANLLLSRAAARRREMALRMSLGAERRRLVRQLLAESGLLGLLGAALGIALAWATSRMLLAMVSTSHLLPIRVTPDLGVLAFTVAVTVATVFLFGTAPALRATGVELSATLKSRGASQAASSGRLSRGLVAGQVALSLLLLAGAGLFLRSLSNLLKVDVGFDRQNAVSMQIDPRAAGYRADGGLTALMQRVEERVAALPGIRAAAFSLSVFDGGGSSSNDITVPGLPRSEHQPSVDFNTVGPHYLEAMGMPILFGRGLNQHDTAASRKVAVVNEIMARVYLSGGSPLGRTFSVGDDPEWQDIEVVGVVRDAKYLTLEEKQMPAAFFPYSQHHNNFIYNFVVRYTGDPSIIVPEVRRGIAEVDPNLPVRDVRTLAQLVDDFTVNRRIVAELSAFFGLLAAFLACVGIYGVMSYAITRRTNEFGIRMALGAARGNVLWVVLREAFVLAVIGVTIGVALALAAGRLIGSLLFGVEAADPVVLGFAVLAMIAVALIAGYVPARRATRIDPSIALRYE